MTASRIALCAALATAAAFGTTVAPAVAGNGTTGNGAPSGAHYTLNLIGVDKGKTADMTGNNGHRIFVGLGRDGTSNTRINLTEGDFGVLDANGTDKDGAAFSLPNPDPDGNGTTAYSVFVRALGTPGGKATMQSCYDDLTSGDTWCAVDLAGGVEPITIERTKGGVAKFENVSKDLLYVDGCTSVDATTGECLAWDQVPLFGDANGNGDKTDEAYFWDYDNQGLKVAQLRFYEVPTDTPWDN